MPIFEIHECYDCSLTPTKNIGVPNSLLSRFDLLFILLDQMDPDIDCQISKHVLRMHQFRSAINGGEAAHDGSAKYGREEEANIKTYVLSNITEYCVEREEEEVTRNNILFLNS
ncbi:hypothetical protein RYX36_001604 [Vicia faba]